MSLILGFQEYTTRRDTLNVIYSHMFAFALCRMHMLNVGMAHSFSMQVNCDRLITAERANVTRAAVVFQTGPDMVLFIHSALGGALSSAAIGASKLLC